MAHPLNVIYVGSYPPRRCGIATFTSDLARAWSAAANRPPRVVALNNIPDGYPYPPEVQFEIQRDHAEDYRWAAEFINGCDADIVSVQHEFGLFGGPAGAYLTTLLQSVKKPVVTTLHTVLRDPEPEYEAALHDVIRYSDALVVMSEVARDILVRRYGAPQERISLIYHGVPDVPFGGEEEAKRELGLEGRLVMLTFGLLSPNKGIETAIDALPPVVQERPDLLYIVLGATHPELKKREGERYRIELERRARQLGLAQHVRFVNRFVDFDTLCRYIQASDLYVTPYLNREQVVSGTLSYALAMGKAVLSTPYWYAQELLADGRGVVVPFNDPRALSDAILALLNEPERLAGLRRAAYAFGRRMVWAEVGKAYAALFARVARAPVIGRTGPARPAVAASGRLLGEGGLASANGRPAKVDSDALIPKLDHLKLLTDDTGLIQHAAYGVPDRRHGYSSDDAGRALVALAQLDVPASERAWLMGRYLSFLQYAQTPAGHFHNFMDYRRQFLDQQGSDDTLGRVVWGLGHVVQSAPAAGMRMLAREMMERAPLASIRSPRAKAYALCGLAAAAARHPERGLYRSWIERFAKDLCALYAEYSAPDWRWFEERITYGNAKMSEALLIAYEITGDRRLLEVGLESLDFLLELCWNGEYFDLIGNQGWAERGGRRAVFSQQPIDAGYFVEACDTAFRVTADERYRELAHAAFAWFHGRNRLSAPLYDPGTGAVADGLDPQGVSENQGAESVVSFLLALARMQRGAVRPQSGREADRFAPLKR